MILAVQLQIKAHSHVITPARLIGSMCYSDSLGSVFIGKLLQDSGLPGIVQTEH